MRDLEISTERSAEAHVPDDLFAVPIRDKWLVYAPLRRGAAVVDAVTLTAFREGWPAAKTGPVADLVRLFSRPPVGIPRVNQGALRPSFLGIIPTRSCNLACRYCAFGAATANERSMDTGLAVSLVDWMVATAKADGQGEVEVHFFGGEPLIAPGLVAAVADRVSARTAEAGIASRLHVATNGYFSERVCRFVGEHFDVAVVSLDGCEAFQNEYRPLRGGRPSFDVVARNVASLARSRARLCLRTCVTAESVRSLVDTCDWLCHAFLPSSLTIEPVQETPEARAAGIHAPDAREFARMAHRAIRASRSRGVSVVYAGARIDTLQASFCPVGKDALIVGPDGRVDGCYLMESEWRASGLDMRIGSFEAGSMTLAPSAVERVRRAAAGRVECARCFSRWHCAGGCHVRMQPSRPIEERRSFCLQSRALTACALLDAIGRPDLADDLLDDSEALERLAEERADHLEDWRGLWCAPAVSRPLET